MPRAARSLLSLATIPAGDREAEEGPANSSEAGTASASTRRPGRRGDTARLYARARRQSRSRTDVRRRSAAGAGPYQREPRVHRERQLLSRVDLLLEAPDVAAAVR